MNDWIIRLGYAFVKYIIAKPFGCSVGTVEIVPEREMMGNNPFEALKAIRAIPANREFLRFLLEQDAEIYADGFEVDYLETAETVGFEPKGPWTGYKSRNLAFF